MLSLTYLVPVFLEGRMDKFIDKMFKEEAKQKLFKLAEEWEDAE